MSCSSTRCVPSNWWGSSHQPWLTEETENENTRSAIPSCDRYRIGFVPTCTAVRFERLWLWIWYVFSTVRKFMCAQTLLLPRLWRASMSQCGTAGVFVWPVNNHSSPWYLMFCPCTIESYKRGLDSEWVVGQYQVQIGRTVRSLF